MLIIDEPTNHLDVDAREALVQALNAYDGAVVIVSHDRHMIELTADRLVLVDGGVANEYNGSMEDYIAFVLSNDGASGGGGGKAKTNKKEERRAAAEAREKSVALRKRAHEAEALVAKLTTQRSAIDRAMFDPTTAEPWLAKLGTGDLMKRRAEVEAKLETAEAAWLLVSEELETTETADA
jgi:ATP-binding cassette subfamily F protein 3